MSWAHSNWGGSSKRLRVLYRCRITGGNSRQPVSRSRISEI